MRHKAKMKQRKDVNFQKLVNLAEETKNFQGDQVEQLNCQEEMLVFEAFLEAAKSFAATEYYTLFPEKALAAARAWKEVREKNTGEKAKLMEHNGLETLSDVIGEVADLK